MAVTAKRIGDAKTGDIVWLYEHDRSVYRDGKYVGRGAYGEVTIAERGRQSFTIVGSREKFDLEGYQRGVRAGYPSRLLGGR